MLFEKWWPWGFGVLEVDDIGDLDIESDDTVNIDIFDDEY